MLQAIIFDMDGVIVDTEYVEFNLQTQFIEKINECDQPLTLAQRCEVVGESLKEIPGIIKRLTKSSLPLAEIRSRYEAFFTEIFDKVDYRAIFRRDIENIIRYAKRHGLKLAVASSSRIDHINNILSICGIKGQFDLIVSGEIFARSKPDPTIYRYTLEKLNVSAENAVAVEDSFYGIQAAKNAGLRVIGYEEKRMIIDQSLADYLCKDMNEILSVVMKLHQA